MATTSDLRGGMVIRYNNDLYEVIEYQHISPGNWRAFVRLRLKNLKTGRIVEDRVRAGSDIEPVRVEHHLMQFLYRDGAMFVFMDNENYDQVNVPADLVGDAARFLKENENADVVFMEDGSVMGLELPKSVVLTVTETAAAVRGNTATDVSKEAVLETGARIKVPAFIKEGDKLKIDTASGEYLSRA